MRAHALRLMSYSLGKWWWWHVWWAWQGGDSGSDGIGAAASDDPHLVNFRALSGGAVPSPAVLVLGGSSTLYVDSFSDPCDMFSQRKYIPQTQNLPSRDKSKVLTYKVLLGGSSFMGRATVEALVAWFCIAMASYVFMKKQYYYEFVQRLLNIRCAHKCRG